MILAKPMTVPKPSALMKQFMGSAKGRSDHYTRSNFEHPSVGTVDQCGRRQGTRRDSAGGSEDFGERRAGFPRRQAVGLRESFPRVARLGAPQAQTSSIL